MAVTRELRKAVDYFETKEILLHENPDKLENVLQNNRHFQQTDLLIYRNIIDNINLKHKTEQKDHISTHTQEARTQGHI